MGKEKSPSGGLPPPSPSPSGRYSPNGSSFAMKPESSFPPLTPSGSSSDANRFSHDISRMSDNPPKTLGHRRAHSEILTLPDDLSFDSDLGVVGAAADGPSFSDDTDEDLLSMYLDMDKFNSSEASSSLVGEPSEPSWRNELGSTSSERPRIRHQHSQSMDGTTSIKPELLMSGSNEDAKKRLSAAKLSELALIDPKRAKRIWANRQSAARSKERKMRYIAELERKVQTLQTEATSLSAQLTLLQRDTNGLSVENNELKLRVQSMEQQVHLQDTLNEALKEEVQHLKVLTGQGVSNGTSMMNYGSFGSNQQFYPSNQSRHTMLAAQQFQQLQIQSQKQQQLHQQQMYQLQQQQHIQQHEQQSGATELRRPMSSSGQKESSASPDPEATLTKD
ncbi:PREDICTED: probable transcription factor PosF21 [Brassica oleracea var. oleracea]|uniref:BZIP domain-containing protein n=1 Tax=Brassica oleracea var. oleracea TaxID=109376 RepID=A0A0D3DJ39_BRAOL|nr:PREDICTED: probable transcription factor PosF21 [Brassica oleracea var. oleracea]